MNQAETCFVSPFQNNSVAELWKRCTTCIVRLAACHVHEVALTTATTKALEAINVACPKKRAAKTRTKLKQLSMAAEGG